MIVTIPGGVLNCLTAGPVGKGTATLLMIHGIQGTASVWVPVMQPLASERHVLAPHLRGRAGSFSPDDPAAYSMAAFAGDLHAVLCAVRGPVVLVGWSMGCLVALEYLRTYGTGGLIGLALISGSPYLMATGGNDATWFSGDTYGAVMASAAARAERLQLSETATDIAVAGSWMDARNADYRDDLGAIDLPVLVLHGAEDPECPVSHARMMAEAIPEAQLEIWNGCGHVPMAYAPERLAAELRRFAHSCESSV
ncbi:alpha/beta fold hydrolase [Paracoccus alkanivorans]|uniref:Alpha/beta hydrolase n=1 Tax=Paracoccus alkanivorans TaxID=2116655 RepID=A0A3M0MDD7_9RHOB|nr:alpha/beta hydrolase [Paracoccus alkanivorans]RMC35706.1 alpha/beta hydrolase [Paracoccus alkanivorans]